LSTIAQILARLDKLEARLAPAPTVEIDMRDVRRTIDLIASRRREHPGWRPCGVGVATLIEAARAAVAHTRDVSGRVAEYDFERKAYPRPTA
jgi:hypothetical protein